jgi:hypothetical protein
MAMKYASFGALLLATLLSTTSAQRAEPQRQLNIRQGPESVFDRPVSEIMSELDGATATGQNGRVGNELVFWGYELTDGREVYLFACAKLDDVDCDRRRRSICLQDSRLIRAHEVAGKVRHVNCRALHIGPGDIKPPCTNSESESILDVGLVQCN